MEGSVAYPLADRNFQLLHGEQFARQVHLGTSIEDGSKPRVSQLRGCRITCSSEIYGRGDGGDERVFESCSSAQSRGVQPVRDSSLAAYGNEVDNDAKHPTTPEVDYIHSWRQNTTSVGMVRASELRSRHMARHRMPNKYSRNRFRISQNNMSPGQIRISQNTSDTLKAEQTFTKKKEQIRIHQPLTSEFMNLSHSKRTQQGRRVEADFKHNATATTATPPPPPPPQRLPTATAEIHIPTAFTFVNTNEAQQANNITTV